MEKKKIAVIFGGNSTEYEVSLQSSYSVFENINSAKYDIIPIGITRNGDWYHYKGQYEHIADNTWAEDHNNLIPVTVSVSCSQKGLFELAADRYTFIPVDLVFPILHGKNGEDGTIQGLFQLAGIPYVGCGVCASAASMDKSVTKLIAATTGVRQANWLTLHHADFRADAAAMCAKIMENIAFPVFIKPCSTGSSVGVSKVKCEVELMPALEAAFRYDKKILAEEFINGREIEVAVLGNDVPKAATAGEIDAGAEFYDYETKYVTSTSTPYIPARIDAETMQAVRDWAVKIFCALGCAGLSRVDFFVTRDTNEIVFNEINTLPGFTPISMYPKMWAAEGVPFAALLDRVIALALED